LDSKKIAMDFWYKFDDIFQFQRPLPILLDLLTVRRDFKLYSKFKTFHTQGNLNTAFADELSKTPKVKESISRLAQAQIEIINNSFHEDHRLELDAFEFFGEGILFDTVKDEKNNFRRPPEFRIHRMDEELPGYVSWHAFIRAASMLGLFVNSERWLEIDRYIGVAASLHLDLRPRPSTQTGEAPEPLNQEVDNERIMKLEDLWSTKSFEQIDVDIIALEQNFLGGTERID